MFEASQSEGELADGVGRRHAVDYRSGAADDGGGLARRAQLGAARVRVFVGGVYLFRPGGVPRGLYLPGREREAGVPFSQLAPVHVA